MNNYQRYPIPSISRRRFLLGTAGVVSATALSACVAPVAPVASTQVTADAPVASTASTDGYPRTVSDFFGPVELRAKPERILTYTSFDLDTLLALGVKPAFIAVWEGQELLPWQEAANDVPTLPMVGGAPNLETIAAEQIDLIIITGNSAVWGGAKERLGDRVPVITLPEGDFTGQLRIVGEVLDLETVAAAKIAEIDKLFAEYTPLRVPQSIKAFGTYGDGTFYMFKPAAGLSKMLERFGMPPLTVTTTIGDQDADPEAVHSISLEQVTELEADLLIGLNYGSEEFNTIAESPLFKLLTVVKDGRFHAFDAEESTAIAYGSVLTIPMARDLLTRALTI
jgi:iron complex transport system substrate-binding protein